MTAPSAEELQANINDYWTQRAPSYDDYQQRPERRHVDNRAWADIWTPALPPAPARVLDVGTGSGHVAILLASLGFDVTAIDLSDGMLERAREHASAIASPPTFLPGDAVAPDFAPGSFDAIVGRYVMWTLRDPAEALANWVRLLAPGGVVAMADSTWFTGEPLGTLYGERPDATLPLAEAESIDDTAKVLEGAGLLDVRVTPLETILDLDRKYGVAPGHDVQLQYLVTGRTPS